MTRILVADDDNDYLDSMVEGLEARGFEAVGLSDPADALAAAEREVFDAALVDLDMGSEHAKDGLYIGRVLKLSTPGVRLVLISGQDGARLAQAATAAGADVHLSKPITVRKTVETLSALGVEPQ
ncbi:MAG: response regulator [Planctomycetota bacterium]